MAKTYGNRRFVNISLTYGSFISYLNGALY